MNHDSPHALARPLPFRNMTGEVIPAFAVMTVLGVSFEHGVAFLNCGKPDGAFRRHHAINGMQDVPAGRRGSCFRTGDVRALYDEGTPVSGEGWGPRPGSWKLNKGFPGGAMQGIVDSERHLARIAWEPIARALVKTTATVAINSSTTAYRIFAGPSGSESDSGFTTVPAARNRSGVPIGVGQWAHLLWINSGWELQPLRQPALCAAPPCGQGIPGRVGDVPGQRECCLFSIQDAALTPVLDAAGQQARAVVYNVREEAIPPLAPPHESYVLVHADSSGRWVCEVPELPVAASPSVSTTTTSAPMSALAECAGTCKWNWSIGQQAWQLADDGCGPTTTTSTTSTTTTTSEPCLCPVATSTTAEPATSTSTVEPTTTTTSTTTTTPTPPCHCVYPAYCGSDEGECTYTMCASGYSEPHVECTTTTSTTTTSCDCNTTTTAAPDPECTNCQWFSHPLLGWYQTFNGCQGNCFCQAPGSGSECSLESTPCISFPDIPLPPCDGKCQYICVPGDGWWLVDAGCPGSSSDGLCLCTPPSVPCEICGAPLETNCQVPAAPTTPAPCDGCYSTTTSTTTSTTPDPCGGGCLWQGSTSGAWSIQENECAESCECLPPSYEAHDDCETARTHCYGQPTTTTGEPTTTTTTTTTTSTTTTTTAAPFWCVDNNDSLDCEDVSCLQSAEMPEFVCGGPFETDECEGACDAPATTTTTEAPDQWYCCGLINAASCIQAAGCGVLEYRSGPHVTEADCSAACATTTTCDPNVDCPSLISQCSIACVGGFYTEPLNLCGGIESQCACDLTEEELALIGTPCSGSGAGFIVPCCNTCDDSLYPCGQRTTTTLAP
jgi:hypothetical protein